MWKPKTPDAKPADGQTVAVEVRRALPLEQAYEVVTDGDRRPLLVLRECEKCKGTDHALLDRSLDNEQTVLLTHWFKCVKLPPNILDRDHPLTNLFKVEKEGDPVPHLFFVDADGTHKAPLPGDQSQAELWDTMFSYLDRCYEGNAKKAVKELRQLLDQYDKIDGNEQEIRNRIDREIEKNGLKSPKLKKLDKDLARLTKDREKLKAREKELREEALELLVAAPAEEPAAAEKKAEDK